MIVGFLLVVLFKLGILVLYVFCLLVGGWVVVGWVGFVYGVYLIVIVLCLLLGSELIGYVML